MARRQYRVGAFTHIEEIYPTRAGSTAPTRRGRSSGASAELSDPLRDRCNRLPGAQSGHGTAAREGPPHLFERYQYARSDRDRFVSQLMVKSITGLLVGIAVSEGAIGSVDDPPEKYVEMASRAATWRRRSATCCTCRRGFRRRARRRPGPEPPVGGHGRRPVGQGHDCQHHAVPQARASPRPARASVTPASSRTCWALCCATLPRSRCRTISRKRSGSRSAPSPTRPG